MIRPDLVSGSEDGAEIPMLGYYARIGARTLWNPCMVSAQQAERILSNVREALTHTVRAGTVLSAEDVRWAYKVLLARLPESEAVITEKLEAFKTMAALRRDLLFSNEFLEKNSDIHALATSTLVLKELPTGSRVWVDLSDQAIGVRILHGVYEPEETAFVLRTLKPGMTVIDLGANIGYFSLLMADLVGRRGKVYACEPLPRNLALLRRSLAENKFQRRVVVVAAAIGARKGTARLIVPQHSVNWGGAYITTGRVHCPPQHNLVKVPMTCLDSLSIRPRIGFIKADIKGAEYLAMEGGKKLLARDRPVIMCECNPPQLQRVSKATPDKLIMLLERHGYAGWRLEGDNEVPIEPSKIATGITTLIFRPR